MPHKTKRGEAALEKLKVFEGVPYPYCNMKRQCVPKALKVVRLNRGRKSGLLGELSEKVGWNYGETVERLEQKRIEKGKVYHENKVKLDRVVSEETGKLGEVKKLRKQLEQYGY